MFCTCIYTLLIYNCIINNIRMYCMLCANILMFSRPELSCGNKQLDIFSTYPMNSSDKKPSEPLKPRTLNPKHPMNL